MAEAKVVTLGCRLNTYESEVIRDHAQQAGLEDTLIVNTCAVTNEAERQARQTIRRLRRENPEAKIVVTGCAAQIDPDRFAAMDEVDRVIGNKEKMEAQSFLPEEHEPVVVSDIMQVKETAHHLIGGFGGRARAFVQVQQGCDHRCTFCIIPFGRGPNRSLPIGAVAEQISTLVNNGFKEVVLSGVDIASYGQDLPGKPPLGQMVRRLLNSVPGLERLRLSSLDPAAIDPEFMALLADEPRLMPHIHLSLQAGDDMVLKRMKRRHSRGQVIELCDAMRQARPDVVFGADLIAGFPTETDEMFDNGLACFEECGLTFTHVFPYSPRPGTPAASMPEVPKAVRKERAAKVREFGDKALNSFLHSCIGDTAKVLVEQQSKGHTEHYAPIRLLTPAPEGEIISAKVTAAENGTLIGEI
ncbi:MAG: tRNA (N(6)-L-threonylcarbamoyladenosine(37)-C(2))-methylthiotransferase MtaB [Rhodospirillales bacterium]|nr:tRNA (N(6)-L-threonylcarbamoyladenosine(37)-C(2))-methylthiotransferase MtaB [Rhodospirillales bacterium]